MKIVSYLCNVIKNKALLILIYTIMTKTYYRSEHTEQEWRILIDRALLYGCVITYGTYGDTAVIDSTETENAIIDAIPEHKKVNSNICALREMWAEHIHHFVQFGK